MKNNTFIIAACMLFLALSCKKAAVNEVDGSAELGGNAKILSLDSTNLYIWANDKVPINPELFGVNNDWAQITNNNFPSFVTGLENMGYQLMRYPGGWESEWYHWNANITPGWDHDPAVPGASASTLKANVSNYTIVVPTALAMNETLWSSEWWSAVSALKDSAVNAINKVGANQVKVVEIGNEWWLQWGGGKTVLRNDKLSKYVKTAMNIAEHIDQQFPERTFKLLVNGDYTVPSEFTVMRERFTKAHDAIDGVALHTYAGYDTASHHIDSLASRIKQCAENFNEDEDKRYVYLSEWAPSKDYNKGKKYMEAANIIPDMIHIYARAGANAAAYWPPINTAITGLGLFSYNYSVIYPCGQIFSELAANYSGDALSTVSGTVHVAAALNNSNTMTLFVTGGGQPATNVNAKIYGFTVDSIQSVVKFRPDDYAQTDKAAPYITEPSSASIDKVHNRIIFDINTAGKYEILKIVLKN